MWFTMAAHYVISTNAYSMLHGPAPHVALVFPWDVESAVAGVLPIASLPFDSTTLPQMYAKCRFWLEMLSAE